MEDFIEWTTKLDESNVTNSHQKEDTDYCVLENELFLWMSIAFVTMTIPFGILGNLMVVTSVYSNKSLRTANNALLVNLASADLTTCTLSSPISWTVIVLSTVSPSLGNIPHQICSLQVNFHIVSSTVQLVTLALIGLERHAAITHPFEKKKKRKRVIAGIIFAWILGLFLGCTSATYLPATPIYILCSCERNQDSIFLSSANLYILTPLGTLCFVVVVYYYFKIYLVVRNHVKDKGTNLGVGMTQLTNSRWATFCRNLSCRCKNCKVNRVVPRDALPVLETQQATYSEGSEGIKPEDSVHSIAPMTGEIAVSRHGGNSAESMMFTHPSDKSSAITQQQHEISSCLSSSSHIFECGKEHSGDPPAPNRAALDQINESYGAIDDILDEVNFSREIVDNLPKTKSHSVECVPDISTTHCKDQIPNTEKHQTNNPSIDLLSQKEFEVNAITTRQNKPQQRDNSCVSINSINDDSGRTVATKTQLLHICEHTCSYPKHETEDITNAASGGFETTVEISDGLDKEKRNMSSNVIVYSGRDSKHLVIETSNDFVSNKDENVATESQIREVAVGANVVGSVCVFNPKNRERGRRNAEAGTAKRAAYIIVVFSLCWLPFFLSTLLNAMSYIDVPLYTMLFFSCTVLFSSVINPIIYTVVNRSFRQEFKRIIRKPAECIT